MGFKNNNRNQLDLLGYSLNDFVPMNAKCRFVVDLVNQLDLSALYGRYSNQGNDAFEPSMLATWFYGYYERVFTTRKLEERCQRDVYFMFVSSNLKPDHSSFSRFRKNNQDLMGDYFVQIIRLAWKQGLSGFNEISIDGSKFQAASSARHLRNAAELEKALKRVREDIDNYMHKAELLDDENDDDINNIPKLTAKIKELKKLEKELKSKQNILNKRRGTDKARIP
jgi:transposase